MIFKQNDFSFFNFFDLECKCSALGVEIVYALIENTLYFLKLGQILEFDHKSLSLIRVNSFKVHINKRHLLFKKLRNFFELISRNLHNADCITGFL